MSQLLGAQVSMGDPAQKGGRGSTSRRTDSATANLRECSSSSCCCCCRAAPLPHALHSLALLLPVLLLHLSDAARMCFSPQVRGRV